MTTPEAEVITTDLDRFEQRKGPENLPQTVDGSSVVMAAIQRNYDPAFIKEMMDLQERDEANIARKAYHKAMSAFKAAPPKIDKDKKVSYGTGNAKTEYSHASLANICEKISSALSQHGLSAGWSTKQDNGPIAVTCTITHELGHSESTSLTASPDTSGSKNAIQAIGSTISYLERYTILALTGLATHDMDDDGKGSGEAPAYINEKQLSQIVDMINSKSADEDKFLAFMQAESKEKILKADFAKAIGALQLTKGKKREPGDES